MFDWILNVIEVGGYAGIFFLMVLENLFPPIPSEVIIPLAGYAAALGDLNIWVVIVVAVAGSLIGSLPWYCLGLYFSVPRLKRLSLSYGRLLTLSPSDIDAAERWFKTHGFLAVLFGRLVPTVRTLISVPAGIARMPLSTFVFYSLVGSTIWTATLAALGFLLETQYEKVADYLNPVSNAVVLLIVGIYLYRVITFKVE